MLPFVQTERPAPSRRNENFTSNQNYPAKSVKYFAKCCCNSLLFTCQFVLWFFLLAVFACTMTARRTNNSLAARLDGENSSADTPLQAESSGPSSLFSAANSAPQTSSPVSAPRWCCWCPRSRSNRCNRRCREGLVRGRKRSWF